MEAAKHVGDRGASDALFLGRGQLSAGATTSNLSIHFSDRKCA